MRITTVAVLACLACRPASASNLIQSDVTLTSPCSHFLDTLHQTQIDESDADREQDQMFIALVIANAHVNSQGYDFDMTKMFAAFLLQCHQHPKTDVTAAAHQAAKRLGYSFIYVRKD